jgi:FtsZ-interacting cell division protein ZipA
MNSYTKKILLYVLGAIVIGAIVYFGYQYWFPKKKEINSTETKQITQAAADVTSQKAVEAQQNAAGAAAVAQANPTPQNVQTAEVAKAVAQQATNTAIVAQNIADTAAQTAHVNTQEQNEQLQEAAKQVAKVPAPAPVIAPATDIGRGLAIFDIQTQREAAKSEEQKRQEDLIQNPPNLAELIGQEYFRYRFLLPSEKQRVASPKP